MNTNVNSPKTTIESAKEALKKQGLPVNIAHQEIKKLKKVLKSQPKSLWKYLQNKEN